MDKLSPPATAAGPSEAFTGPVWFDVLYRGAEPSRARVNAVHFAPGSHTWTVTGAGAGNIGSNLTFTGVETLASGLGRTE